MSRKNELKVLIEKTKQMMKAPSCYAGLKERAQSWLDSLDTEKESHAAKVFIKELEADITPIDGLVAFAHSEHAAEIFGKEFATNLAKHADEIKAAGAKYCDCAACTPGLEILAQKSLILIN